MRGNKKKLSEKKAQANAFANKGGNLRAAAKKLRQEAEKLDASMVDIKREDKHLRPFIIPMQGSDEIVGAGTCLLELTGVMRPPQCDGSQEITPLTLGNITIYKGFRLRLTGPNGCGKSTLLKSLLDPETSHKVCDIRDPNLRIGYYSQDFSELEHSATVIDVLREASQCKGHSEQYTRHIAATFFLTGSDLMKQTVGTLSEGQKGLLSFACLVLTEPGLIIMDEPTNHINFRHIPAIAKALSTFEGGIILVSHDRDFCKKVKIDKELDIGSLF